MGLSALRLPMAAAWAGLGACGSCNRLRISLMPTRGRALLRGKKLNSVPDCFNEMSHTSQSCMQHPKEVMSHSQCSSHRGTLKVSSGGTHGRMHVAAARYNAAGGYCMGRLRELVWSTWQGWRCEGGCGWASGRRQLPGGCGARPTRACAGMPSAPRQTPADSAPHAESPASRDPRWTPQSYLLHLPRTLPHPRSAPARTRLLHRLCAPERLTGAAQSSCERLSADQWLAAGGPQQCWYPARPAGPVRHGWRAAQALCPDPLPLLAPPR